MKPSPPCATKAGVGHESPPASSRDCSISKMRIIPQTAEMLETSERTVQRLIKQQKLRAHYLGRLVRIADADIAALLDATRTF